MRSWSRPLGQPPSERSGDETRLTLVPMHASLVYRFDVLAQRSRIPLVPNAKLGLSYAFWWVTEASGRVVDPAGPGRGRGGTLGWHGVIGLALLLDVFDPVAARSLDVETGVNHSYVFFEYGRYDLDGLGSAGRLNVSDTTWNMGLLFEL